jgi:histidine triad (HIT) family protein
MDMTDCLFCKIVSGDIPATVIYDDDRIVAFNDVNPKAPTHVLIIPRAHVSTLNDLTPDHDGLVGEMVRRAALIAKDLGHAEGGYRTVFNCNADAGQSVFHIHLHLLAGRTMAWPPG